MLKHAFLPQPPRPELNRYGFTQEHIHSVHNLLFQIQSDIKITMCQYKIIDNILPTKVSLFKVAEHMYSFLPALVLMLFGTPQRLQKKPT